MSKLPEDYSTLQEATEHIGRKPRWVARFKGDIIGNKVGYRTERAARSMVTTHANPAKQQQCTIPADE